MKPIKPINLIKPVKPNSFAQKRKQDVNSRYRSALDERKKIVRAQYASPDFLKGVYKQKGLSLDRKINKLKSEKNSL